MLRANISDLPQDTEKRLHRLSFFLSKSQNTSNGPDYDFFTFHQQTQLPWYSFPKPVLSSHGNHHLLCQVHSTRVTSALWLFHQPTPASKETCGPYVPFSILLSLFFLPTHPIQTSEKILYSRWWWVSSHSPGILCTNLFQKRAGLTLRALAF